MGNLFYPIFMKFGRQLQIESNLTGKSGNITLHTSCTTILYKNISIIMLDNILNIVRVCTELFNASASYTVGVKI